MSRFKTVSEEEQKFLSECPCMDAEDAEDMCKTCDDIVDRVLKEYKEGTNYERHSE